MAFSGEKLLIFLYQPIVSIWKQKTYISPKISCEKYFSIWQFLDWNIRSCVNCLTYFDKNHDHFVVYIQSLTLFFQRSHTFLFFFLNSMCEVFFLFNDVAELFNDIKHNILGCYTRFNLGTSVRKVIKCGGQERHFLIMQYFTSDNKYLLLASFVSVKTMISDGANIIILSGPQCTLDIYFVGK